MNTIHQSRYDAQVVKDVSTSRACYQGIRLIPCLADRAWVFIQLSKPPLLGKPRREVWVVNDHIMDVSVHSSLIYVKHAFIKLISWMQRRQFPAQHQTGPR